MPLGVGGAARRRVQARRRLRLGLRGRGCLGRRRRLGSAAGASAAGCLGSAPRPAPPRPAPRLGRRLLGGRRGGRGGGAVAVADDGDHRADLDRLALLDADLGQRAGHRRRHLGVDLVRRHLEQRLVGGDVVADLLEPLRDGALGDGLTELGQGHVGHAGSSRSQPLKLRPVSVITVSPNSSVRLGWGWMNSATSSTVASQLTAR